MQQDLPVPPSSLRFMEESEEDFFDTGDRMAAELREFAFLKTDESILDIGSGYGRIAAGLWRRGHRGNYLGMDILSRHIQWCSEHITPATGGLYEFKHLDVQNDRYNPTGNLQPTEVSLDLGFRPDVILLASVFTHMHANAIIHYLGEIRSVLPETGRAMATFFLINQSQQTAEAAGHSQHPLRYKAGDASRCWTLVDRLHVIAYYESWVRRQIEEAGLRVEDIHLGSWCGRHQGSMFQDTVILTPRPMSDA